MLSFAGKVEKEAKAFIQSERLHRVMEKLRQISVIGV
jgi:hypothetical protein